MKKRVLAAVLLVAISFPLWVQGQSGLAFSKEEYAARRHKLMDKIPDGVAIIWGAHLPTGFSLYSQSNDFMYFTGADVPGAVLIIDGKNRESTLFFTISESTAGNEGISFDLVRNPLEVTGIEKVAPFENFNMVLGRLSRTHSVFYTSFMPQEIGREVAIEKFNFLRSQMLLDEWDGRLTKELQFVKLLKERFPATEVKDLWPHVVDLRVIKSPAELEKIRKAGAIGVKAMTEMMRSTRAGMYEYEIAAVYEYFCKRYGSRDIAYNTIISSDKNHPYLHYYKHDRLLNDGDFLVVDVGPDIDYYDIDITISYPANGKFTQRQKEFYTACLEIQEACKKFLKAGRTGKEIGELATQYLIEKGIDLNQRDYKTLEPHLKRGALTHYVGMAVHDSGGGPGVDKPLQAGMVIAIDVYSGRIEENTGVRVEDTVVITEEGYENLNPGIVRTIEDIENLMKQKGVAQILKDQKIY